MPAIKTARVRVAGLLFLLPSNTVSTSFCDCPEKTHAVYRALASLAEMAITAACEMRVADLTCLAFFKPSR
jgi:hypothetical protein